ncbi:MAG: sigma-70 family RNA polymerase sigma factor [Planctomycetota bacterium]
MASADEKSFEALALPHLDTVYRVAYRLTRDEHEAEDLVQETYLKAFKGFADYEVREFGIRPWLLRILHNTFLNRIARQKRAPRATDQQVLEQVPDQTRAVPPKLDYEKLDAEVKAALDQLSPEFRAVVLLWASGEMSYQEIAEVLDVPIGTVMSRLHRARQQLAAALDEYAREQRIPMKSRP